MAAIELIKCLQFEIQRYFIFASYIWFLLQSDTSYFSSSDWSTLDFFLIHMINVL